MRNELPLLKRSGSRWFFLTGMASSRNVTAAVSAAWGGKERAVTGSRQGFLALRMYSEGEDMVLKQLLC